MKKTKTFNYEGKEYNYRVVSFGYTELIIISMSYDGTYVQVYNLANLPIKQAMKNYKEHLKEKGQ